MSQDRESKLPIWAQDLIADLRRKIESQAREIAELQWNNPDSDTFLEPRTAPAQPLPRGSTIRFQLGGEGYRQAVEANVARDKRGDVYLRVSGLGGSLAIQPVASNAIEIRQGQDDIAAALRELVERCDGEPGVRADGSNIDTRRAHIALANL